jgi:hypothetical protein
MVADYLRDRGDRSFRLADFFLASGYVQGYAILVLDWKKAAG